MIASPGERPCSIQCRHVVQGGGTSHDRTFLSGVEKMDLVQVDTRVAEQRNGMGRYQHLPPRRSVHPRHEAGEAGNQGVVKTQLRLLQEQRTAPARRVTRAVRAAAGSRRRRSTRSAAPPWGASACSPRTGASLRSDHAPGRASRIAGPQRLVPTVLRIGPLQERLAVLANLLTLDDRHVYLGMVAKVQSIRPSRGVLAGADIDRDSNPRKPPGVQGADLAHPAASRNGALKSFTRDVVQESQRVQDIGLSGSVRADEERAPAEVHLRPAAEVAPRLKLQASHVPSAMLVSGGQPAVSFIPVSAAGNPAAMARRLRPDVKGTTPPVHHTRVTRAAASPR